jgi:hypothetical protein
MLANSSAHFPKFVFHRSTHFHELRKDMGTYKPIDPSAAFLFEVPGSNSPLVVQELQIGGTSAANLKFLSVSLQVLYRNFKFKAAPEAYIY